MPDVRVVLIALALVLGPTPMTAQIPTEFTNLQVLPNDIERRELIDIMRGFAGGLGVRCDYCHVGENAATLENFDFASDEKETKEVARVMLAMVEQINDEIIPLTGRAESLQVTCFTCHHANTRPETLQDAIRATLEEEGLAAAVQRYRDLREQYYGRAVYDFGASSLNRLGEDLARGDRNFEAAVALLELDLEYNPDASFIYFTLGGVHLAAGDTANAIQSYERLLESDPENGFVQRLLADLKGSGGR